jgi:hypothetical protein
MKAKRRIAKLATAQDLVASPPCRVEIVASNIPLLAQLQMSAWARRAYEATLESVPVQFPGRPAATKEQVAECRCIAAAGGPLQFEFAPEDGPTWDDELAAGVRENEALCEWADDILKHPWKADHVVISDPPADFPKPVAMTWEERSRAHRAIEQTREVATRPDGSYYSKTGGLSRFTLKPTDATYFTIPYSHLKAMADRHAARPKSTTSSPTIPVGDEQE